MSNRAPHDNDDNVPNLGDGADGDVSGHSAEASSGDDNAKFNEATVIRPRSVLDDAFDAHTVVRTESMRRAQPAPAPEPVKQPSSPPPSQPVPPPTTPHQSFAPPASSAEPVTNPSISRRFRKDASVTNFPIPPKMDLPPELKEKEDGPTPAQLAEAQKLAQAQEHAKQKAEQAAKLAAEQAAAQKAEQKAAQKAAQEAAAEAARRAQLQKVEQEAAANEAARRARQSAQPTPSPAASSEPPANFRFEETQSNYKVEPQRRQINFKMVGGAIALLAVGWFVFSGSGSGDGKAEHKKDMASSAPSHEVTKEPAHELKAPPSAPEVGANGQYAPAATVLSSFEDAFSRTQVRSRPDSQD